MSTNLTMNDHHAMHQDGWCIAVRGDGFQIERIPATPKFKDDACAWLHVFDLALEREPLAMRAMSFIEEYAPLEFGAMARYIGIYRPGQVASLKAAA